MEYIYSAMLLHTAGKEIKEENIKKVLTAAGVKVDDARVKALIASLKDVDIDEAIKTAAAPVATVAAPVAQPTSPEAAPSEEKKEEKKKEKKKEEEVSEEEAAAGLGALFG